MIPGPVRYALRIYAAALWLLPGALRREHGSRMHMDLRHILADSFAEGGAARVWRDTVVALTDVVRWAVGSRLGRVPGGLVRTIRSMGMGDGMMGFLRELRMATRSLMRRPGFASIAVLTLGLGMGSVLAIFTLVNGILLEPLPYQDSDRLVEVQHHAPALDLPNLNNSSGTLFMYEQYADVFEGIAGITGSTAVLTGVDQPAEMQFLLVTPSFFSVFRTAPMMGRPFNEADSQEGAPRVAILLNDEWQSRFGGDPAIVGRTIQLDGEATEVVGVMGPDFRLVQAGPVALGPLTRGEPVFGTFGINAIARLAPGVSIEEAATQVTALQSRIPEEFPGITPEALAGFGWSASVTDMKTDLVEDVASTLWVVLGTVGFVLLIACANVANLFLVRAEDRQKEVAVRAAMGAGRGQVAASFLNEALVLSVAGGVLGVAFAAGGVSLLTEYGPQNVPRLAEVSITPVVLGAAGLLVVATGLLLGALPMTRYSARAFAQILRDGGRGATVSRNRHRARNALVTSQLALALVLLVGSGLMFRSFAAMRQVELGFSSEDILAVDVRVGAAMERDEAGRFYQSVQEQVAALPGVVSAGFTTQFPLSNGNTNGGSFFIESRPRTDETIPPVGFYRGVTPGYFETAGIELIQGRTMEPSDFGGDLAYVWVDEHFAETFLDGNAVGQRISWTAGGEDGDGDGTGAPPEGTTWAEVAGVFRTVKHLGVREEPTGNAYLPMVAADLTYPSTAVATLAIRTAAGQDEAALTSQVREIITRLNGQVPVTRTTTGDAIMSEAFAGESITLVLLGIAAGMALFLGSIGLFGVISYVVSQRTREIGVRIALGADGGQVRGMVLKQGAGVTVAGVALGLVGAIALTRLMGSLLFEVSATDPVTFAVAPVILVLVSVAATWLPANRASRVDPMSSLRDE